MFLENGSITFLSKWQGNFGHPQYPLLLPSFFASIYFVLGGVSEVSVSLISSVVYIFILFVCYSFLRKLQFSVLVSLFFTYVYSMVPVLMAQAGRYHAGMPDIYIAALYWVAVWFFYERVTNVKASPRKKHFYTGCVVFSTLVASQIKFEGIVIGTMLLFFPTSFFKRGASILIASIGVILWQTAQYVFNIPAAYGLRLPSLSELAFRFFVVLREITSELLLNIHNWYFFGWLFLGSVLLLPPQKAFIRRKLQPVFVVWAFATLAAYLFSTVPIIGYPASSFDRLFLQVSPVWFLILVDRLYPVIKRQLPLK